MSMVIALLVAPAAMTAIVPDLQAIFCKQEWLPSRCLATALFTMTQLQPAGIGISHVACTLDPVDQLLMLCHELMEYFPRFLLCFLL